MSENTLRRHYAQRGLRLRKLPERSRWYPTYGPFMAVDGNDNIIEYGMDLRQASEYLR